MTLPKTVLRLAIGAYPHTEALLSGRIASDLVGFDPVPVSPINRAFAPMVREGRFDLCEMAIGTFLQAEAFGRPLTLLPIVVAARFQEAALLTLDESPIAGPADLAGRRVGVRAYSQTTGLWLRGILRESFGLACDAIRWVTFEDAHVAEYRDPPFVTRAEPGRDMMEMLRQAELDAVIVGNDVPAGPWRSVFPDPASAGEAFRTRHGFMPPNHLLVIRSEIARAHPAIAGEIVRMMRESAAAAPPRGFEVVSTFAALEPAIALARSFAREQQLLPE